MHTSHCISPYTYHSSRTNIQCTSAYKRAYIALHTPAHTHKRRSTDGDMPDHARKNADTGRSSTRYIWYISPSLLPKNIEKIASITVSYD